MAVDIIAHMYEHLTSPVLMFVLGFMVFDIITGLVQAVANKCFSSKKMREGFFHKMAIIFVLFLAIGVDAFVAGEFGDIGIVAPIFNAASIYIVIMELASILENILKLNPNLAGTKLMGLFSGIKEKSDEQ